MNNNSIIRTSSLLLSLLLAPLASRIAVAQTLPARRSAPDATTPMATAAPTPPARLGWAGLSLRLGRTSLRLDNSALRAMTAIGAGVVDATVNSVTQVAAGVSVSDSEQAVREINERIRDLHTSLTTLTPGLHLGGDGYFFRLEAPIRFGENVRSYGVGLYPMNYGAFIRSWGVFPYMSLGFTTELVQTVDGQGTRSWNGFLGQARAAFGIQWRAWGPANVMFEVGYSLAAGQILDEEISGSGSRALPDLTSDIPATRGGYGKSIDFSIGIGLL